MLVSVLSWDLSHNCLGRAYLLAQLLEEEFEVEIVGPKLRGGIWTPVKDEYEYKTITMQDSIYGFIDNYESLLDKINGDVIYASKPRTTSFGIGLIKKKRTGTPLILDIDDWERSLEYVGGSRFLGYSAGLPRIGNINSLYYNILLEQFVSKADAITVSNTFLQERFGGHLLPHVRDTDVFDPSKYDKKSSRRKLGLPLDDNLILFSGTPKPHKGLDHLVSAVSNLGDDTKLVIVGADQSESTQDTSITYKLKERMEKRYMRKIENIGGDSLILRGRQPFSELPAWIAAADIVAIPQKESHKTRGQLPAKVFDAMAMGRPVVATNVSDLPDILSGCGEIVPPESTESLQTAIKKLLSDTSLMNELGENARNKAKNQYSYQSASPTLCRKVREVYSEGHKASLDF